ncbi:glucan phosphoethanolaminetransferase (alkaline phosphatase superfamily) [Flavobacterium sp. HSC-32F16]|uniref:hypothetical protein n=1 Tax=Flavobacterium sp. HSC-32F16 TaxID=2910964 RepID=UPI0020A47E1E|nr:hypothetical protein [Flavobacterium sp. HSC-32F16]MCP2028036.1 glucan phosphoethanolaminetransferase (alkaline phosphatase superfamily) [Flavobacterium sp. HSC-32F16]
MNKNAIKNHIVIRVFVILVFYACYFFSEINKNHGGGNNFISDNFFLMMLGLGILFGWIAWMIIEAFVLLSKQKSKLALINLFLLIVMAVIPLGSAYLKHKYY